MPTTAKKAASKQASSKTSAKRAPATANGKAAAKPQAQRKEKRTFRFEVVVKSATGKPVPVFAEGMGAGVLYSVDCTFNLTPKEYDSPLFAAHMLERMDGITKGVIEGRITPVANP